MRTLIVLVLLAGCATPSAPVTIKHECKDTWVRRTHGWRLDNVEKQLSRLGKSFYQLVEKPRQEKLDALPLETRVELLLDAIRNPKKTAVDANRD